MYTIISILEKHDPCAKFARCSQEADFKTKHSIAHAGDDLSSPLSQFIT